MNTKYLGNLTELQCITRFYELGLPVSIPYGDSEKYDMILDVHGNLYRLQCKHANPHLNSDNMVESISINTCWTSGYTRNKSATRNKYSKEDCDYFVTFYDGKAYLIPVEECSFEKTLRILPLQNSYNAGIYHLPAVFSLPSKDY